MIIVFIVLVLIGLGFLVWACSTISSGIFVETFCKLTDTPDKVVYLTFDDGPSKVSTSAVLDVLARHKAKATFFMVSRQTRGNEDLVLRAVAEGHQIGNHTSKHSNFFPLYGFDKMMREITTCTSLLESITGTNIRLFRPPFGVTNPTIGKCLSELGYACVGWSIRTFDTKHPDSEYVLDRVRKNLEPGAVILLHDRLSQAPDILEKLLCYLEDNGYCFDRPLPV